MVERMEVKGVHFAIDDNLRKYIDRKLGRLDRFLSAHSKQSFHMEVVLKESKTSAGKQCHCEATLHLPHDTICIKEHTMNMYAAVDIVEAKLKMQLKKYKDIHDRGKLARRLSWRQRKQAPIVVNSDL